MIPNNKKAVIFDLDGTLLDSMNIWHEVDRIFLSRRNIPLTEDYTQALQTMHFSEAARYTKTRFSLPESEEEIVREWMLLTEDEYRTVPLMPYAKQYLIALHDQGIKLGIATSSNRKLFLPALKHHAIERLFSAVATVDDVSRGKEFPDVYLYAAKLLSEKAEHCAVVEDVPQAAFAAKSGGFYTILISNQTLLTENADIIVSSLQELIS